MKLNLSELLGNEAKSETTKQLLPEEVVVQKPEEVLKPEPEPEQLPPDDFNYDLDPLDIPTKNTHNQTQTYTHTHTYIEEVFELLDRKPYDSAVFREKLNEDSIKKVDEIKAQIEEDVKGTVDPFILVFQLLDMVGLLEGDLAYCTSVEERIKRIYGEGLLKRTPLLKRKEELVAQLHRLEEQLATIEKEERPDEYTITCLKGATTVHRMRIEDIERRLAKYK